MKTDIASHTTGNGAGVSNATQIGAETSPEKSKLAADITDKRGYGARWSFSVRHVDNLLAQGMPHLAIGKRRVRIVIAEADAWMREKFATRRRRVVGMVATKEGRTA